MLGELKQAIEHVWHAPPDDNDRRIVYGEAKAKAAASPWIVLDAPTQDGTGGRLLRAGDGADAFFGDGTPGAEVARSAAALGYDPEEVAARVLAGKVAEELERRKVRRLADEAERPPLRPIADELIPAHRLDEIPAPAMYIRKLMPDRAVGFLNGRSGSYKSFVLVALAHAIATGRPVMGRPELTVARPGKVLYVAGEGSAGVALRIRAAAARWGELDDRVALLRRTVDLGSERAVADLYDTAARLEFTHVFIDTFRQATPGVKENDNTELSIVIATGIAARDYYGISTLYADHTGHAGERAVGGEAKWANVDFALMVRMPNGSRAASEQRTLTVEKLKDQDTHGSWDLRLVAVPEVRDQDDEPSAVVEVGAVEPDADIHGLSDWRELPLPADVRGYDGKGKGRGELVRVAQLVMAYGSGASGISRQEVARHLLAEDPKRGKAALDKAVSRGWDALHDLDRLEPVNPSTTSRTGAHQWVLKPGETDS